MNRLDNNKSMQLLLLKLIILVLLMFEVLSQSCNLKNNGFKEIIHCREEKIIPTEVRNEIRIDPLQLSETVIEWMISNEKMEGISLNCHSKNVIYSYDEIGKNFTELFQIVIEYGNKSIYLEPKNEFKQLSIKNAELKFFPDEITQLLPNITMIELKFCGLLIIKKENLQQFAEKLIYVDLEGNSLTFLESNLFFFNSNLEYANFNDNLLQSIDFSIQAFQEMKSLRYFIFYKNICISFYWVIVSHHLDDKDLARCNASLIEIDYMKLKNELAKSSSEEKTSISCKREFSSDRLYGIFDLLQSTMLTICQGLTFVSPMKRIASITFEKKSTNFSKYTEEMETLDLSKNTIYYFPRIKADVVFYYTVLIASDCKLKMITAHDMEPFCEKLQHCIMSHNNIQYLEKDLFKYNKRLLSANFQDNPLILIGSEFYKSLDEHPLFKRVYLDCGINDYYKYL